MGAGKFSPSAPTNKQEHAENKDEIIQPKKSKILGVPQQVFFFMPQYVCMYAYRHCLLKI